MTQIKLRRDTAANFTSKNPVLGVGEPAYETDTKKLKIGDGTTAYNNLDYFAGGGGSTEFTVVQPLKLVDDTLTLQIDEQTIQVQDGKLVANLDELGNEVNTLAGDVAGIQADLANKQDKLTAGDNITISTDNIISASGGGLEVKRASSANFNSEELLETGLYFISGGFSPQNGPVPYAVAAMLITLKTYVENNNQNIQQTWIGCEDLVGNQIYTRYSKRNGVMNAWTRVDSNKIASASALGSIKVGDGLTISTDGTLSASGGGGGDVSSSANNTFTGENTFNGVVKANNIQTTDSDRLIEYESGTLQIGNNDSIQSVTIRADGPITDATGNAFVTEDMLATTNSTGLVKVDGTTITVDEEGKISTVGGGSSSGDVTKAGNNTFTGTNSFQKPIILDETGSTLSEIQVRYTNDSGSLSTAGLITPDNFSLGETYATLNIGISKIKTNFFGKSFNMENSLAVNGAITISNTGTGQVNKLRLSALNGSATATTLYNGLQIYTDSDTYTSTLRVGDKNIPTIIQGSTIKDNNNAEFVRLVESHIDETGGYRLYSDGYCEQWGDTSGVALNSITFLKPYRDTKYIVLTSSGYPDDLSVYNSFFPYNKTKTGFSINWNVTVRTNMWRAFGYVEI